MRWARRGISQPDSRNQVPARSRSRAGTGQYHRTIVPGILGLRADDYVSLEAELPARASLRSTLLRCAVRRWPEPALDALSLSHVRSAGYHDWLRPFDQRTRASARSPCAAQEAPPHIVAGILVIVRTVTEDELGARTLAEFAWRCPNGHLFATAMRDISLPSWRYDPPR